VALQALDPQALPNSHPAPLTLNWEDDGHFLYHCLASSQAAVVHWYVPHMLTIHVAKPPHFSKSYYYLHYAFHIFQQKYGIEGDAYFFGYKCQNKSLLLWAGEQTLWSEILEFTHKASTHVRKQVLLFPKELEKK